MPRRGTKLQRHLDHFKETGQMTEWLAHRLEWDTSTSDALFSEMYGRTTTYYQYYWDMAGNIIVNNPRSAIKITGISLPADDDWLAIP